MQAFKVYGMTCSHCVHAVTEAVQGVAPGAKVDVNLAAGSVTTDSELQPDRLADAIRQAGYTASPTILARL